MPGHGIGGVDDGTVQIEQETGKSVAFRSATEGSMLAFLCLKLITTLLTVVNFRSLLFSRRLRVMSTPRHCGNEYPSSSPGPGFTPALKMEATTRKTCNGDMD